MKIDVVQLFPRHLDPGATETEPGWAICVVVEGFDFALASCQRSRAEAESDLRFHRYNCRHGDMDNLTSVFPEWEETIQVRKGDVKGWFLIRMGEVETMNSMGLRLSMENYMIENGPHDV